MKKTKNLLYIILTIFIVSIILGIATSQRNEVNEKVKRSEIKINTSTMKIDNLSIIVLFDNYLYKEGLKTSWGFSCIIKGTEKTILFDTGGDGSILLANMEKLDINPEEIDLIVLSHIHGDHVGGLNRFLEINPEVDVYVPESFPKDSKDEIKEQGANVIDVQNSVEICENVYSTGELGTSIIEQSLIIQTEKGLIVITGCAHPGIVEIVEKAKTLTENKVLFVMGGFHLVKSRNINDIVSNIRELGVLYVGPCHCSGDEAREIFKSEYGDNYINVGAGRIITTDDFK